MSLYKYVLIKNLNEKLKNILYHNNILIDTIYYNITTTESIYTQKHLFIEIHEINFENVKIKEILFDINYFYLF
jgi:hypothetical protein